MTRGAEGKTCSDSHPQAALEAEVKQLENTGVESIDDWRNKLDDVERIPTSV